MLSHRAQANENSRVFEQMMSPIFEGTEVEIFSQSELKKKYIVEYVTELKRCIIKNEPHTTSYRTQGKAEFVIVDGDRRIRGEARYQATEGSVAEHIHIDMEYTNMQLMAEPANPVPGKLEDKIAPTWLDFKLNGKDIKLIAGVANWFTHEFS